MASGRLPKHRASSKPFKGTSRIHTGPSGAKKSGGGKKVNTGPGQSMRGKSKVPLRGGSGSKSGGMLKRVAVAEAASRVHGASVGPVSVGPLDITGSVHVRKTRSPGRITVTAGRKRVDATLSVHRRGYGPGGHWASGQKRDAHGRFS